MRSCGGRRSARIGGYLTRVGRQLSMTLNELADANPRADATRATFCLNHAWSEAVPDQLAARRLTLLSASVISFLSVAFSSSRVFFKCWRNRCGQAALP